MKKSAYIIILAFCVVLSGCKKQSELGDNEIVTTFFVNGNGGIFEISAYTAETSDDEEEDMHTAYGDSISKAYASLMSGFLHPVYTGHAGAIVLGDGLCESGLKETVEFFADLTEISPNISVFMSEDSPKSFSGENIHASVRNGYLPTVKLYTLFLPHNKTLVIPVISAIDKTARGTGAAVCKDMNFKYYLTESEYTVYRLISNNLSEPYFDGLAVVDSKCTAKNDSGNLKICAKIQVGKNNDDLTAVSEKLTKEITALAKKARENDFKEIFSDGKWNTAQADVRIFAVSDGNMKGE